MSDVTRILSQIECGDPAAAEQLLPLVYDELRKLAAVRMNQDYPGQTLQPTALVHEAYLRLVDQEQVQQWNSRGHFFAAALSPCLASDLKSKDSYPPVASTTTITGFLILLNDLQNCYISASSLLKVSDFLVLARYMSNLALETSTPTYV